MTIYAAQKRRTLTFVVLFFLFLTVTIGGVGYKSYRNFEAQSRADTARWLSVVANTKADSVIAWQNDLLSTAGFLYKNSVLPGATAIYLRNPQDAQARSSILAALEPLQDRDEIDGIDFLNTRGENISALSPEIFTPSPAILQEVSKTLETRQITLVDFYRVDDAGPIHLAVLIPIIDAERVVGLVALRIDPFARLYPILTSQIADVPTTMQTYLVRGAGDSAQVLSPLSFNPDAALSLEFPMEQTEVLEVKAVLGQTGIIEAASYGGGAVIADVRTLGRGWILVTQTSVAKLYNSIRVYFVRTVVVTGIVVFYSGLGLALIWRQQLLKRYQVESETAQKRAIELDAKVRERTAELSALSRQIADLHEKQIRDLARELHDGVGQNLTAINLNLTLLRELLPAGSSEVTKSRLTDTSQLVQETVARMRNVMADFLPPMLDHYGLTPALTWYGEQLEQRANLIVNVHDLRTDAGRMSPEAEVGLFRIGQETLNNVAKHAGATQAEIELSDDEDFMYMTISDNGQGFDPQVALSKTSHWGLAIIRERARVLGGTLEIQSAPSAGTKIIFEMKRQK